MTVVPRANTVQKGEHVKDTQARRSNVENNPHRRRPVADLRTSGVIVHLAPGARERHVELLVTYYETFGTRSLLAHAQQRGKKLKRKWKHKEKEEEEEEQVRTNSPN